jgi:hypothetical protein
MHQSNCNKRNPALAALLLLLASLALAACGSSSSSTTSSATTTNSAAHGATASRFAAVRACLQKNGITLPKPTPGQGRPGGGFQGSGGPHLPAGVTRAQYEAAIKKCGGFSGGRFGAGFGGRALSTPAGKAALAKFATCMHENGVNVPPPNTSGKGPIFNDNGLNTTSSKFRAAQTKCSSALRGLFRAHPGGTGGASPTPGGGGAGAPGEATPGATGTPGGGGAGTPGEAAPGATG